MEVPALYLPVVNPDVGKSVAIAVERSGDQMRYTEDQLERLDEENPAVACFIREWAERSEEPLSAVGMVCLYRILESQAEADAMMEEIPIG
jgi:hypothetical protein